MKHDSLTAWKQLWHRMGMPGLLGCLLAAGSAWAWFDVLPAMREDLAEQQAQIDHVRHQLRTASSGTATSEEPADTDPMRAWSRAWSRLPSSQGAMTLQATLLDDAQGRGLSVASVQYQGGPLKRIPGIWRQQLTLPFEGPYPAMRAWLDGVLADASVSIDMLDFSRTDVMTDTVKGRVSLSLWWRTEARP